MKIALFAIVLALSSTAHAEEHQCTPEYVGQLRDDLLANEDVRKWTTNYLRPLCRAVNRGEDLSGKVLEKIGAKWLWEKTVGDTIDPKSLSRACRYIRSMGEELLTPEEDEKRIRSEIERCEKN